jgi:hypothetical protein
MKGTTKTLITGRSGRGKTTLFLERICASQAQTFFVFDHEGEFAAHARRPAAKYPDQMIEQLNRGFVLYDPEQMFPGDLPAAFDFYCEWSFEMAGTRPGKKLFCCDELQKLVGTNTISHELALVMETGRRRGLDFLGIAQGMNLVHNRVSGQLSEVVTFHQVNHRSIEALESMGFNGDEVRALGMGEYLALDLDAGEFTRGQTRPAKGGS